MHAGTPVLPSKGKLTVWVEPFPSVAVTFHPEMFWVVSEDDAEPLFSKLSATQMDAPGASGVGGGFIAFFFSNAHVFDAGRAPARISTEQPGTNADGRTRWP
jgi:hypothetical protein